LPRVHLKSGHAATDPLLGQELGVYHCESLLGQGGMGRVYLALHTALERYSALKVLAPERVSHDPDYLRRFQLEGRAAAALNHPNVVTTHAIGQADDYHYLEMEFVPGGSLQQYIHRHGPVEPVRATALVLHAAEGLAAAHRAGIIHRDLKLDNILLDCSGQPKIADFGLAKRVAAGKAARLGESLCGTPNYMAPELWRGDPASPTSDVYALGICYFVLLTGRSPYRAASLTDLQHSVMNEPLPGVRTVRPEVTLEMAECLDQLAAKSPTNRPRDGIEAAELLRAVLGDLRDLHSLVTQALKDAPGIEWTHRGTQFRLVVKLPDGRRQKVFIEPSHDALRDRLVMIYSNCCPAQSDFYERALRLNAEMRHGAIAIRNVDGVASFVVIDTYPRATVDPEEIRKSVWEVARRADAIEKRLTGEDRN